VDRRSTHRLTGAGNKSLFGSFSSEKGQNLLFLKKKKQKDFYASGGLEG
jgi:hypothetical protein